MSGRDGRQPYHAGVSEPSGSDEKPRKPRRSPEEREADRTAKREVREARLASLEDRYALAAILIVATIITTAIGGDDRIGQFVLVVVESATLIVILHASNVSSHTIRIAVLAAILAIVFASVSISLDRETVGPVVIGALIAFVGPVVIIRRIRDHARIDLETVAASLCIYLLAGIFFSYVYRVVDVIGGSFFAQKGAANALNFLYFSFVTLTTLGYGDLSPGTHLGKMLSVSEALLGQIYLVSVVAMLVANLGRERRPSLAALDDDPHDRPSDDREDDAP